MTNEIGCGHGSMVHKATVRRLTVACSAWSGAVVLFLNRTWLANDILHLFDIEPRKLS